MNDDIENLSNVHEILGATNCHFQVISCAVFVIYHESILCELRKENEDFV